MGADGRGHASQYLAVPLALGPRLVNSGHQTLVSLGRFKAAYEGHYEVSDDPSIPAQVLIFRPSETFRATRSVGSACFVGMRAGCGSGSKPIRCIPGAVAWTVQQHKAWWSMARSIATSRAADLMSLVDSSPTSLSTPARFYPAKRSEGGALGFPTNRFTPHFAFASPFRPAGGHTDALRSRLAKGNRGYQY